MALQPHQLDNVFRGSEPEIRSNIAQATEKAILAKRETEQTFRDNPGIMSASPAQVAREKFLEVLSSAGPEKSDDLKFIESLSGSSTVGNG